MPATHTLLLFTASSLAVFLTPGTAVLFVLGQSVDQGLRAGWWSSVGLALGGAVQLLVMVLGLGLLADLDAVSLGALQAIGAVVLVGLGLASGWSALRPSVGS